MGLLLNRLLPGLTITLDCTGSNVADSGERPLSGSCESAADPASAVTRPKPAVLAAFRSRVSKLGRLGPTPLENCVLCLLPRCSSLWRSRRRAAYMMAAATRLALRPGGQGLDVPLDGDGDSEMLTVQ